MLLLGNAVLWFCMLRGSEGAGRDAPAPALPASGTCPATRLPGSESIPWDTAAVAVHSGNDQVRAGEYIPLCPGCPSAEGHDDAHDPTAFIPGHKSPVSCCTVLAASLIWLVMCVLTRRRGLVGCTEQRGGVLPASAILGGHQQGSTGVVPTPNPEPPPILGALVPALFAALAVCNPELARELSASTLSPPDN